jgi:cytochrome P450
MQNLKRLKRSANETNETVSRDTALLVFLFSKIRCSHFFSANSQLNRNKYCNTMVTLFSSSKHAVEGFPMIPDSNPLFGHLLLMRDPDFRRVIEKFSVEHADPHGRCCFWMGTTPALSVTAPQDVQLILKQSSHRTTFSLLQRHIERFLGRNSIGILSGREWKKQRSAISKALHTAVSSDSYGISVVKATQGLVDALLLQQQQQQQQQQDSATSEQQQQQHYELGEIMKLLTLDIFGQTAMHADFKCCHNHWHQSSQSQLQTNPIAEAFDFLASEMMRRMTTGILDPASQIYSIPTPSNRKQAEQREFLRGYIADSIEQRRQELAASAVDCPHDLLTAMIQVEDLSEEELTDTLLSLLFAGYETTAATLTYAIYLISQHASVEEQCLEEIEQQANADSGIQKNPEDYPYLQAVLMETLRLYPPAISTTRSLEKELVLNGIPVPEGTYLYIPIWTIQRDSKNFPEPLAFRPERWAVQKLSTGGGSWELRDPPSELGNAQAWVPFSAGARSCVGQRFAIHEMTLALAVLVHNLEFQLLDPDYELIPYRSGIVQTPKGGLPMIISKRGR